MEEIDLYDLLRFYVKKWLTVAIFVMLGAIIGIIYTYYIQTPQYTSKATLLVVGAERTASDSVVLNNYVELFTSRRVLDPVIESQNYTKDYEALVTDTIVKNVKNTDVIDVTITTSNAKTSKLLLEGAIESFRSEAKELYGDNNVKINVVDSASTPEKTSNIRLLMQVALAAIVSFVVAVIGLFFVYDYRLSQKAKTKNVKATAKSKTQATKPKAKTKPKSTSKAKSKATKKS